MGLFLRCSRSRTKICGGQKEIVRLLIEAHRFGAVFGRYRFDFCELVRGILVKNVDFAFAGGDIQQLSFWLEDVGVDTGADGQ